MKIQYMDDAKVRQLTLQDQEIFKLCYHPFTSQDFLLITIMFLFFLFYLKVFDQAFD